MWGRPLSENRANTVLLPANSERRVNGKLVKSLSGYTVQFVNVSMDKTDVLREGKNTIAVHCHQSGGGQGIDVGLVERKDHKQE